MWPIAKRISMFFAFYSTTPVARKLNTLYISKNCSKFIHQNKHQTPYVNSKQQKIIRTEIEISKSKYRCKMNLSGVDNISPIGQSIETCKEDILSILNRLKHFFEPCDLDTARGFSENLKRR